MLPTLTYLKLDNLLGWMSSLIGGLDSNAAEKGLVEMQKAHPDAKRICRNEFEAADHGAKVCQQGADKRGCNTSHRGQSLLGRGLDTVIWVNYRVGTME